MKKISEYKLEAILRLAEKYNVGIQDFNDLKNLFTSLEDVVEVTQADVIPQEIKKYE